MQGLSSILSLTAPVFILMGMGFLSVRQQWLTGQSIRALAWFILYFGLPAAMFKALSSRSFADIWHVDYLLLYGLASLFPFFVLLLLALLRGKGLTSAAFFGLGASLSNSLMIGFPIIFQLFGESALIPFALTLIIENLVILPLALALADTGQKKDGRFLSALFASFPRLLKNPIIISMALGMAFSLLNLQPPLIVGRVVDMLSATVGGLALFTIGGLLVGFKAKGIVADVASITMGKLILHPIGVALALLLFPGIPPLYQSVALVLACMPMFSVYAVLGVRYNLGELCSAVLLPTALLSFITINIVIWLWVSV